MRILTPPWKNKVTAIQEAKELDKSPWMNLLEIWELMRWEIWNWKGKNQTEIKAWSSKLLKVMVLILMSRILSLRPRNSKGSRKPKEIFRKESSTKAKVPEKYTFNRCYKCQKLNHRIKDCSIWKIEWEKKRAQKERKEGTTEGRGSCLWQIPKEVSKWSHEASFLCNLGRRFWWRRR